MTAHEGDPAVTVLSPMLRLVRAANPGPMTLEGTNTWMVGDPTRGPVAVVDPGPLLPAHQDRIAGLASAGVAVVLLTHRHLDHSESAADLAHAAGCGVRAADPALRRGPEGLVDGDRMEVPGAVLTVVATPGHTSDSVSLLLTTPDGSARLVTGDTVLGRGTTVITHPDGDVGAYLESLDVLEGVVRRHRVRELLPGHGPLVGDPLERLRAYRDHRRARLAEVRAALAAGDRTAAEVVARVYAGVDPSLRPAAEQSVRAQLDFLGWTGPDS
ncbi:MAG: hypothetical protein JWP61_74 [Friedmanniella sp.]|nr:hypothetical protein [Friedmanniella sp.]